MDLSKFVALLRTSSLYFARSDLLGDPFEGSLPKEWAKGWDKFALQFPTAGSPDPDFRQRMKANFEKFRKQVFVNCWHMNDHESDAMWKLYLQRQDGIAVQSTYERLRHCFDGLSYSVFLGMVKYVDYNTYQEHYGSSHFNAFDPYTHKRVSFQHESEIRAVVARDTMLTQLKLPTDSDHSELGLTVSIDLNDLVENVYVAPFCPDWAMENITAVIERFGYQFPVQRSTLADTPSF